MKIEDIISPLRQYTPDQLIRETEQALNEFVKKKIHKAIEEAAEESTLIELYRGEICESGLKSVTTFDIDGADYEYRIDENIILKLKEKYQ